jgi:UDP-GlcNAc:undecaprenyl-phosphate GlcNAc-1-phosphate transferase
VREYLVVLFVAAAATYLLTPIARVGAVRVRALAEPRDRDVHAIATPRLGGLAMYAGILIAMLVARNLPALQVAFRESDVKAVLAAGGVICLLGVADDKWGLDALTKLAGQVVAAGVMVLLGLQLLFVLVPGRGTISLGADVGVPLTVLLVLVTVNAINFVDGLDGLAAGVVGIAALAFFAFSYQLSVVQGFQRASPPTLITAVLAGACLGFLPHNFNPARVFMGDSGSMLIGLMLAAATTSLTGQLDPNVHAADLFPALLPLLLPLAVLAVPFIDLVMAVIRRARAGRSPFSPDKEHLHHRLLEIGHSHTRAVLIMYFWTATLAFGAVALSVVDGRLIVLAVTAMLVLGALVASGVPRLRSSRRP